MNLLWATLAAVLCLNVAAFLAAVVGSRAHEGGHARTQAAASIVFVLSVGLAAAVVVATLVVLFVGLVADVSGR